MAKEFTGRAARLEKLRKARKMKKCDLAALLNVTPVAFQGWLDRGISEKALTKIALALHVRREWFDEDTPVESAEKDAPVKYAEEVQPGFTSWQFIQNFIALPDAERDQFVATLQKLLSTGKE